MFEIIVNKTCKYNFNVRIMDLNLQLSRGERTIL